MRQRRPRIENWPFYLYRKEEAMASIAFITDLHLDEDFPKQFGVDAQRNWEKIQAHLKKTGISHLVIGGDIGEPSAYPYFFKSLESFSYNIILGNHDNFTHLSGYISNASDSGEHFYKKQLDKFTGIFLDSSSERISKGQLEWLRNEINSAANPIVFIHHPILMVNTEVDRLYPLANREELKSLLFSANKPVHVISGHYHMADEREEKNIRQWVSPAVSFRIEKNAQGMKITGDTFGYRLLHITSAGIETTLIEF